MLIVQLWKHKWPAIAATATMFAVFFWPAVPLKGIGNWLQFFYYYTPQNILYGVLTILSGLYAGIYVYNKKVCTTCSVSAKAGATGMLGGVLLGACPACIPVLAFFLPLGVSVFLSRISWVFLILSIALMAFLIYKMNGFKKCR